MLINIHVAIIMVIYDDIKEIELYFDMTHINF